MVNKNWFLVLVCLLSFLVLSGCAKDEADDITGALLEGAYIVRIVGISPAENSVIKPGTTITAQLEYKVVTDGPPCKIGIMFKCDEGHMVCGNNPSVQISINNKYGSITHSYTVHKWDTTNSLITKPYKIKYFLTIPGDVGNEVQAESIYVTYNAN